MKTSLNIDDSVYEDARKEAARTGRTLSETIGEWARIGRNSERQRQRLRQPTLAATDLGAPRIDIDARASVADALAADLRG